MSSSQRQACRLWARCKGFVSSLCAATHVDELLGFETITDISEIPTDEKARPKQTVMVLNCGELVLRKKTVTSPAPLQSNPHRGRPFSSTGSSASRSRSPSERKGKRRRSLSRHSSPRSRSPGTRSPLTPPKKSRKHKKSGKMSKKDKEHMGSSVQGKTPIEETEEELDARYLLLLDQDVSSPHLLFVEFQIRA
jgi:peptidyl-prolyl isomerase G (cyclophilin G)